MRLPALGPSFCLALSVTAAGAEFTAQTAHKSLIERFNSRDWAAVRKVLADDVVFHRANAKEVFIGADAVVAALKQPIAESWNVKFAALNSTTSSLAKIGAWWNGAICHNSRIEQRDLLSGVLYDDVAAPSRPVLEASNPGLAGCRDRNRELQDVGCSGHRILRGLRQPTFRYRLRARSRRSATGSPP